MSDCGINAFKGDNVKLILYNMHFNPSSSRCKFFFSLTCLFNVKEKQDAARAALAKKTDEAVEDDEGGEEQENEDESEDVPQLEGDEEEVKDEDAKNDDEVEEEGSEDAAASEVSLKQMW
jgi:hypothetical protein